MRTTLEQRLSERRRGSRLRLNRAEPDTDQLVASFELEGMGAAGSIPAPALG